MAAFLLNLCYNLPQSTGHGADSTGPLILRTVAPVRVQGFSGDLRVLSNRHHLPYQDCPSAAC